MTEAKIKNGIFPLSLAPGTTDAVQHVDQNNGKLIKADIKLEFQKKLDSFDWEKNPLGKSSAKQRRMEFAQIVDKVVQEFPTKHPNVIQNSAIQCGMALAIDGSNLEKVKPALCVFFLLPPRYSPHLFQDSRLTSPRPSNLSTRCTGTSDAEADLVFLADEVDNLDEDDGDEEDVEEEENNEMANEGGGGENSRDEAAIVQRARGRRRRYCLEGCDCERTRGRLCECEKRGDGMCGDECQCDPTLCRTMPCDDEDGGSSEGEEEEDD